MPGFPAKLLNSFIWVNSFVSIIVLSCNGLLASRNFISDIIYIYICISYYYNYVRELEYGNRERIKERIRGKKKYLFLPLFL